jgi:ATP-dependent DNA helicase RecG
MNLMFETAIRQGKPLPDFAGTASHEVRLTLEGSIQSPAFVRFLERLGEERIRSFSTYDFLALDFVHRDRPLPDHLKSRLPRLIELSAVESIGRGRGTRYILSQALYSALGARGVHTRKRGLDHETNKALIEKHLQRQGSDGAPFSEVRQVLPSLSESAVKRLLAELRTEGRASMEGQRRWARWYALSSIGQDAK